jgi:hypothetical protein
MISQIFRNTQQVRIWLGEHTDDSEKLFDELNSHFRGIIKLLKRMDGGNQTVAVLGQGTY